MKLNKDDLYWTNKKHTTYAVLVSPGYGVGWSTWNSGQPQSIAFDKRIVKYIIEHQKNKAKWESDWQETGMFEPSEGEKKFKEFLRKLGYDVSNMYFGGVAQIEVNKVSSNSKWRITEYDGWETFEINDPDDEEWSFCE